MKPKDWHIQIDMSNTEENYSKSNREGTPLSKRIERSLASYALDLLYYCRFK